MGGTSVETEREAARYREGEACAALRQREAGLRGVPARLRGLGASVGVGEGWAGRWKGMPAKYRPDQDTQKRLRHAAWKGDVRLARAMLDHGAKLEATDSDHYTPLLIAARWNRIEMVKVRAVDLTIPRGVSQLFHGKRVPAYLAPPSPRCRPPV